ncbi:MAG: tetratricopeptide repeat protein [Sedimentisphaerales bacterium]
MFDDGRVDEAIQHLSNAVRISPTFFDARNNLGKVLLKQGKLNEAVVCFNELLKRKKDSAELYYNLGIALNLQNKYEEAVKCFARALELDAKYPDAHNKMGTALLAAGKNIEAIKYLNEALRISSNDAGLYEKLGNAYAQSGRYEQAIQNWTKTAELKPDSANVLNNLAWLLATVNNTFVQDANKAIELAHHACELTDYNEPSYMDTLAVAYAAAGRFEDAVMTAQQAVDTAKSSGQEKLASEIQNRLELYQAGRPYRGK